MDDVRFRVRVKQQTEMTPRIMMMAVPTVEFCHG